MSTPLTEKEKNRIKLQGFLEDKLKWHDYTHIAVGDDDMEPATHFVHTVGLARSLGLELILAGALEAGQAMDLIADVVAYGQKAGGLTDGQVLVDEARLPLMLKDVSTDFVRIERVVQATSRYGADLRVFQVVWPDAAGRFPTDPAYDRVRCPQQMLWEVR
jgi:hypothetical protein